MSTVLRRWRPLAAVAAAVVGFVLVPQGSQAGALPLTPGITPGASGIVGWSLDADDVEASFLDCSGLGSRSGVLLSSAGAGDPVTKSPGAVSYPDVTCILGLPGDGDLYLWRDAIATGDADRRNAVLVARNALGAAVQTWDLANSWPSQYIQAFDRVVVVLTHERSSLRP